MPPTDRAAVAEAELNRDRAGAAPGAGGGPGTVRSVVMAKSGARKVIKPVAATIGVLGTMASIWWFALKPRRKAKNDPT
jgi:hypothetical protein